MAEYFHVAGTAQVKLGIGTGGALSLLGHSVNGISIDLRNVKYPVYTDAGGGEGGVPATYQKIGQIAIITGDMIVYDETVMVGVRAGDELAVEGVMIPAGTIMDNVVPGGVGNKGFYRLLVLAAQTGDLNWNFPTAHLVGTPVRMSSRTSIFRCTWEAIPFLGAGNNMNGVVLYNRVTT